MPYAYVLDNTPGAVQAPDTFVGWGALPQASLQALHARWTRSCLISVEGTLLMACATDLPIRVINGVRHVPLHLLEEMFLRTITPGGGTLAFDLARGVAPKKFNAIEGLLTARGFAISSSSASVFAQRVLDALEEVDDPALVLDVDDVFPLEAHDPPAQAAPPAAGTRQGGAAAAAPQAPPVALAINWIIKITYAQLQRNGKLGPMASLSSLIGERLRRDERHAPAGRCQLVAATLSAWARQGHLALVGGDAATAMFVAAKLVETQLPKEIVLANVDFPAILSDLNARNSFANASERAGVIAARIGAVLTFAPSLDLLLAGVNMSDKFGTIRQIGAILLPSNGVDTIADVLALDRHLAAGKHDLTARPGEDLAARLDRIFNAARRDTQMGQPSSAPVTSGSSSGSAGGSLAKTPVFHHANSVQLRDWLRSAVVTDGLVIIDDSPDAVAAHAQNLQQNLTFADIDANNSGLLAMLRKIFVEANDTPTENDMIFVLQLATAKSQLPVVQFLLNTSLSHPHELFLYLARARPYMRKFLTRRAVTNNDGSYDHDDDWQHVMDVALFDDIVAGKWDIDWRTRLLLPLLKARCEALASPASAKAIAAPLQWFSDEGDVLIDMVERITVALGFEANATDNFETHARSCVRMGKGIAGQFSSKTTLGNAIGRALTGAGENFRTFTTGVLAPFPRFLLPTDRGANLKQKAQNAQTLVLGLAAVAPGVVSLVRDAGGLAVDDDASGGPADDGSAKKKPRSKGKGKGAAGAGGGKPPPNQPPSNRAPSGVGANKDAVTVTPTGFAIKHKDKPGKPGETSTFLSARLHAAAPTADPKACWPCIVMQISMRGAKGTNRTADEAAKLGCLWCPHPGQPGHENASSPLHLVPTGLDFATMKGIEVRT